MRTVREGVIYEHPSPKTSHPKQHTDFFKLLTLDFNNRARRMNTGVGWDQDESSRLR